MSARHTRSTRPDRVTVWFVADEQVGVDVRWAGIRGDRRANAAHERLRSAGHQVSISKDALGWRVRLCPVDTLIVGDLVSGLLATR
ncbi:MAG TPA: hypothetical protein VF545_06415 [Thermoleophilaceae bacterium]|jgi:hypothetical protein